MNINVFLADPLDAVKVKNVPADIKTNLQGRFDKVVQAANNRKPAPNPPHTVTVQWSATKPSPSDTDLLIYFVTTDVSIVGVFSGKPFDPLAVSHWGYTNFRWTVDNKTKVRTNEAASEVYAKNLDACDLAALAFHEAMHHKLLLGNDLHKRGGLASASVNCQTPLTADNISAMAGALTTSIKQWSAGFDKLATAKQLRDQGDPMWYTTVRP